MKEEVVYRWRGWILGVAIIGFLLGLLGFNIISLDQAMSWVEKLFDKISH